MAGTLIGGACLWILNQRSTEEQEAAWEFAKSRAAPGFQAYWHINTGYYPVNTKGCNHLDDVAWSVECPQFQVAIDQLHMAPLTNVTAGGLIGVFPEARQPVETALEECFSG